MALPISATASQKVPQLGETKERMTDVRRQNLCFNSTADLGTVTRCSVKTGRALSYGFEQHLCIVKCRNLMIMDLLTNANDGIQTNTDSLQAMRGLFRTEGGEALSCSYRNVLLNFGRGHCVATVLELSAAPADWWGHGYWLGYWRWVGGAGWQVGLLLSS